MADQQPQFSFYRWPALHFDTARPADGLLSPEEIALLASNMVFAQYKLPEAADLYELTHGLWLSSDIVDVFAWAITTLTQRRDELRGRNDLTGEKATFMDTDVMTKLWTSMYGVNMPSELKIEAATGAPQKIAAANLLANLDDALGEQNTFEFLGKKVHFLTGTLDDVKARADQDDGNPRAHISAGLIGRNIVVTPLILDVPGWVRHITVAFYDILENAVYYYDSMQTATCAKFWKKVLTVLYQHRLKEPLDEIRATLGVKTRAMRFVDCISPLYLPTEKKAFSVPDPAKSKYGKLIKQPAAASSKFSEHERLKPPHQVGNGTECGVFVCYYMYLFLTGRSHRPVPLKFSHAKNDQWIANDPNCTVDYMTETFRGHMARFFAQLARSCRVAERNVLM
jgi:hypothetical protein